MKLKFHKIWLAVVGTAALTIYGCGGGGGGGSAPSSTFLGTAAIGAPIVNGNVTVIDATGSTVGTATTGSDGSYTLSFDPTKFTAPFVITVNGNIGEASTTLVSVQASQPTSGSNNTVNITPITNAIAARLSSTGNPADLTTNIATEKTNITSSAVATNEQAFRDILRSNMTSVGLAGTANLISGTFSTQLDKLLDNIQIQVTTAGDIQMTSSAGTAVNDLGDTGTQPVPVKVATLLRATPLSTVTVNSLLANLPAPSTPVGVDVLAVARKALNDCFAQSVSIRQSSGTNACTNLVATGYLHDGRNAFQEFNSLSIDSGNDNMQFRTPEILRQLDTTLGAEKLVVRLSAVRTDGQIRSITTVARNTSTGWELFGNQRDFETYANGVAVKRISANTPANNRYETGLNLYVGANINIASAVVTGPGLPAGGITLKPKPGCDFLAIADSLSNTPFCASVYRFRSLKTDGTTFTPNTASAYLFDTTATDSSIQSIQPLDLYKYVITKTNNGGTLTYWNRLRSRPLTVAEMGLVRFVDFTPATTALMTTATLYTGGTAPTVSWSVPANGPRPFRAGFFHTGGSDFQNVPFGASSATIPCSSNSDCSGNIYKTGLDTTSHLFLTIARNRFDTQILTQISK